MEKCHQNIFMHQIYSIMPQLTLYVYERSGRVNQGSTCTKAGQSRKYMHQSGAIKEVRVNQGHAPTRRVYVRSFRAWLGGKGGRFPMDFVCYSSLPCATLILAVCFSSLAASTGPASPFARPKGFFFHLRSWEVNTVVVNKSYTRHTETEAIKLTRKLWRKKGFVFSVFQVRCETA